MSELLNDTLASISLNNRPYGNLAYEQKIDQIFLWMEDWDRNQINNGVVKFVKNSSLTVKRSLRTILEPLLHRDYIYHNFDTGPNISFSPISTFITRELYEKLEKDVSKNMKRRQKETYRLASAHLKTEVDAKKWSKDSILPNIKLLSGEKRSKTITQYSRTNKRNLFSDTKLNSTWKDTNINQDDIDRNKNRSNQAYIYNEDIEEDNFNSYSLLGGVVEVDNPAETTTFSFPLTNKKATNKYLFQSPSRASTLQRSKTQFLPAIKHSPGRHKVLQQCNRNGDVFQKFPLSLKANRRHLQSSRSEGNLVEQNKTVGHLKTSFSTPNIHKTDMRKKSPIIKYEDQLSRSCLWLSSWNEWQQEYFMQMLLKLLSSTQLYFMYAILMVQLYCNIITLLPDELSLKILRYLRPRQLISYAKVSRRWRLLCRHDKLWANVCKRKKIISRSPSFFKSYLQQQKLSMNWRDGRYLMSDFLKQTASVTTMDIHEDMLATGGADKLIKIWKLTQGKCILVLEGHQKCVWTVQFVSSLLLISCSNDQTIKIWNLRTGCCTRTILGHDGAVWCLRQQGEYLVSGSSDKTAKVWALRSCSLVRSFSNHPGGVYSVAMSADSQKVFTGTVDKTIRIWDVRHPDYIASLQVGIPVLGALYPVTCLSYDKGYLWSACNNEFQVWDTETLKVVSTYGEAHKKIECGHIRISHEGRGEEKGDDTLKGKIITCGKDGKLKIWNLTSSKPIITIYLPDEEMNFVKVDEVKILFACHSSQEASVKIVDFSWNI